MTVTHFWAGAPGPTSFRVKAKVSGDARLAVSTNSDVSSPAFFPATAQTPTSDGIVDITATGLANDTRYYYAVEVAGVVDTSLIGQARTHKPVGDPYTFTFAAWSCVGGNPLYPGVGGMAPIRMSNHPGFLDIAAADPLFNVHIGDMCYYNPGRDDPNVNVTYPPDVGVWRDMYNTVLTMSHQSVVYRKAPTVYTWSNHDYGQTGASDKLSDGTFPYKTISAQAYRERNPSYPLAEAQAIYHSFQVGRVLFVVTDSRYYRDATTDPAPRSMYGTAQTAWLDNLLATKTSDPNIKALCWVSDQPTMSGGSASWGVFPEERADLYAMFRAYGWSDRMFEIAGDTHQLAFDTGTHTDGWPLYVFSSIDSSSSGAGSGYDIGTYVDANRGQYGLITVEDPGPWLRWTAKGYSYGG